MQLNHGFLFTASPLYEAEAEAEALLFVWLFIDIRVSITMNVLLTNKFKAKRKKG